MKNYGAQLGKIKEMYPDKSEEECQRINDAYYKAFPGVKNYHQYCYNIYMLPLLEMYYCHLYINYRSMIY